MGKIFVSMTYEVLDLNKAVKALRSKNCGAEILFLGTVRNNNENQPVQGVNYDGHTTLGEKILREICTEAQETERRARLSPHLQNDTDEDLNFWVEHRLGLLEVGEVSLIIHITSPHRDAAYQASRYVIEQIKLRLPVWKEELYVGGKKEWLKGQPLNSV